MEKQSKSLNNNISKETKPLVMLEFITDSDGLIFTYEDVNNAESKGYSKGFAEGLELGISQGELKATREVDTFVSEIIVQLNTSLKEIITLEKDFSATFFPSIIRTCLVVLQKVMPHFFHLHGKEEMEILLKDIINDDRRLRFGYPATDYAVEQYYTKSLEKLGLTDMWFIVDDGYKVVASCHVSYCEETNTAEMGCTVSPEYRGKKLGQELFQRGATWARMKGAENIFMQCLSENEVIQHIAKKNSMTVVTIGQGEKEATIKELDSKKSDIEDNLEKLEKSISQIEEALTDSSISAEYQEKLNELKHSIEKNVNALKSQYILIDQSKKKV